MRSRYQFDTGVDTGRKDTALMRAEPRWPGRLRLRLLAAVLIAAFAALTIYAYTANVSFGGGGESLSRGQRLVHDDDGGRRRG